MNKVKYQIFISSTYDDLIAEREQIIKACLEMGHIPVGMEMFSAADEEQWQIITRQIDDSDYYVLIVANRYGSVVDGISYTEKEYNYAVSKGIPVLGFILADNASWPSNRAEMNADSRSKFDAFKAKIKRKPIQLWANKEELYGKCSIALMKTFNTQPRPGWVRSSDAAGPEVVEEITRLSSENSKFREQLAEFSRASDVSHLAQGADLVVLNFNAFGLHSLQLSVEISTAWNDLYLVVAQAIIRTPLEREIGSMILSHFSKEINAKIEKTMSKNSQFNIYMVTTVALADTTLDIVKTQFMALELIQIDYDQASKFSVLWKLTAKGQKAFTSLTAIEKVKGYKSSSQI